MARPRDKYRYQELVWGADGQARVRAGRVGVFGLGGTGAAHAHVLARAGVGFLRLVDRDIVEYSDLHRSPLYDEADAAEPTPKAEAAARRLAAVNADVKTEAAAAFVGPENAAALAAGVDVLVDGADNFTLRFLLNDLAVQTNRPLIYQGAVGGRGVTMAVIPGVGPCLRCLVAEVPAPGAAPTCAQVGVSPAVVAATAALGAGLTLAVLRGLGDDVAGALTTVEEAGRAATVRIDRRPDCPTCGKREFSFLAARPSVGVGRVCGGRAYEVFPGVAGVAPLDEILRRYREAGRAARKAGDLIVVDDGDVTAIVFKDGRALVYGARDETHARALYDRFVGQ